jgi:hypothetical protein
MPYDPSLKLRKNQGQGIDQLRYSQIIGSLMYLDGARIEINLLYIEISFISHGKSIIWDRRHRQEQGDSYVDVGDRQKHRSNTCIHDPSD